MRYQVQVTRALLESLFGLSLYALPISSSVSLQGSTIKSIMR